MNAKGVLINITGGNDVTLRETQIITDVVNQIVDLDEGEVFFGTVFDPDARDEIRVTVIATGLTRNSNNAEARAKAASHVAAAVAQQQPQQTVEDDDIPAIQRQYQPNSAPARPAATSTGGSRPNPMSIQDYLKNNKVSDYFSN
jgi:cell division protein FtsZ